MQCRNNAKAAQTFVLHLAADSLYLVCIWYTTYFLLLSCMQNERRYWHESATLKLIWCQLALSASDFTWWYSKENPLSHMKIHKSWSRLTMEMNDDATGLKEITLKRYQIMSSGLHSSKLVSSIPANQIAENHQGSSVQKKYNLSPT